MTVEYDTVLKIVEQLMKCKFVDEVGNNIENNVAFISLVEMSKKEKEINYDCR